MQNRGSGYSWVMAKLVREQQPTTTVAPHSFLGSEPTLRWMYVADALALFALMIAITVARFGLDWPNYPVANYLGGFVLATFVHLVVAYFGGLYDRENRLGSPSKLSTAGSVSVIAVLIDAALSLGAEQFLMPRLNLIVFGVLAAFTLVFNRWLARRVRTARYGRPRVLLVGAPDDVALIEQHLAETDRDAHIVGRTATVHGLADAVDQSNATDVLLLGTAVATIYPYPLSELERRHIGLYHRLSPEDTLLGIRQTVQIAGVPFIVLRSHALRPSKAHLKRLLDLIYLFAMLPLIVLVVPAVLLYARIVAGNPILFRQQRVGRRSEPFTMIKLRTMYPDAETRSGPVLADRNDVRVIPAMSWLRATRLDELPQLWNVLKGEMSLVGPRPERPELASQFEALIPGYGRRHDIRPGLTGLAQIHGDYHTDPGYKLGHDLQYLVNWSPVADLQILAKTVAVVLRSRG